MRVSLTSILLVAAACGGADHVDVDAPVSDAAVSDAAVPDGAGPDAAPDAGAIDAPLVDARPAIDAIAIDAMPAWTGQFAQKLTADAPNADALFGSALAMSADGTHLAIGARGETGARGAIYVFKRSGTTWTRAARLTAAGAAAGQALGTAVAISADGGVIVATMPAAPTVGQTVRTFVRTGPTTWVEDATTPPTTGGATTSIALSRAGDRLAVGTESTTGLWVRSGSVWVEAPGDLGGREAALSGDGQRVAFSHANLIDVSTVAGATPVYESAITGDLAAATAPEFALAFDNAGTTLVYGAPRSELEPAGEAALWARYLDSSGAYAWTPAYWLVATNHMPDQQFGCAVARADAGGLTAVGARGEDSAGTGINSSMGTDTSAPDAGAAYVFAGPTQEAYIKAPDTAAGAQFGAALAMSADGRYLAIGAPAAFVAPGAVYLYQ